MSCPSTQLLVLVVVPLVCVCSTVHTHEDGLLWLCRQEEEKRKQLELLKKREERQHRKQAELDAQKDLWSHQDEAEMGGSGQVEGGVDQLWSTDQRGIRMPWTGASVPSPVGPPSLLEIQEQEFKQAEQKVRRGEEKAGEKGGGGRGREGRRREGEKRGGEGRGGEGRGGEGRL